SDGRERYPAAVGRLRGSRYGRQFDLDRVGIREPDLHAYGLADQQLHLRQHTHATGELGNEDLEDRPVGQVELHGWESRSSERLFFCAQLAGESGKASANIVFARPT